MNSKALIITTIIFFLLVNTSYYWAGKLGEIAFPFFLILGVVYIALAISLVIQIYFFIKKKFSGKQRFFSIGLLIMVLTLSMLKPVGIIDFEKFAAQDLFIAERAGSANCLTILKLKADFSFRETIGCFGQWDITGNFKIANDTIFFDNVQLGRNKDGFYKFEVIKPSQFGNSKNPDQLIMYKDLNDKTEYMLWIRQNQLGKLRNKQQFALDKYLRS